MEGDIHCVLEDISTTYTRTDIVIRGGLDHQLVEVLDNVLKLGCEAISSAVSVLVTGIHPGQEPSKAKRKGKTPTFEDILIDPIYGRHADALQVLPLLYGASWKPSHARPN
jgi:hypothetical protein